MSYYLTPNYNTGREVATGTVVYPISSPRRQTVLPVSQHYALLSNAAPLLSFSRELRLHQPIIYPLSQRTVTLNRF